MEGYVYALYNQSFQRGNDDRVILKVGKTAKYPEERARELYTTGVPSPFLVAWSRYVPNMDKTEKDLHDMFDEMGSRYNASREFFVFDSKNYDAVLTHNACLSVMSDLSLLNDEYEIFTVRAFTDFLENFYHAVENKLLDPETQQSVIDDYIVPIRKIAEEYRSNT